MTFCVAWRYEGAVYLVADTLRTSGTPSLVERTSLNEPQKQIGRDYVDESLLKIREICDGVAVGIAGDVDRAFSFVDFLRDHIHLFDNFFDLFAMASTSCGPFDPARHFELLLVHAIDQNIPTILKWDSDSRVVDEFAESAAIGSIANEYKDFTLFMLAEVRKRKPNVDAVLYSAIALIQSYGRFEDLLLQGVGGVVCGLRVQTGSTFWQDDTITVIYRDDGTVDGRLSTHFREGIALVNSTYKETTGSVFHNRGSARSTREDVTEWLNRWTPYLGQYLSVHFAECTR